ncbi:CBM_collapsed_G0032110.mRNA.1.CDS.1 [Saccharomyces cerevisiae]|nr:CBM_collapsed_G0032110.mRNA.1.CDS.1 [Saccharomyces cerevisiae]
MSASKMAMSNLEKILELVPLSPTSFVTKYLPAAPVGSKGTFGGTLVSQSLLASLHTVPLNFFPTSLHSYFIKGGDPRTKITYHVQNLRNGRNFIHKQVSAYQHDKLIFTSMILFAVQRSKEHDSLQHWETIPGLQGKQPDPHRYEEATSLFQKEVLDPQKLSRYASLSDRFQDATSMSKPPITTVEHAGDESSLHKHHPYRIPKSITPENDARYNYVAFAYLSDSYLLLTIPYFHNLPLYCHSFSVSLDHTIYFHQLPHVNNWIYLKISNPRSHWDKHLVQGKYFDTQSGRIMASVSQEGYVVYGSERDIRAKF